MVNRILRELLARRTGPYLAVHAVTDDGVRRLTSRGYSSPIAIDTTFAPILPDSFKDRRIAEIRCNNEDVAIRLDGDMFIVVEWSLYTGDGSGYIDVALRTAAEVDPDFLTYFSELNACGPLDGGLDGG